MYAEYASYFQKLNDYLKWQTERIRYLESRIDGLEQELDKVKSQDRIRIDKIEYNFDQLKVEKLDGTLNVGIAPRGWGLRTSTTWRSAARRSTRIRPVLSRSSAFRSESMTSCCKPRLPRWRNCRTGISST